jgi:hypothetical protein
MKPFSKRSLEGEVVIDHRDSPGLPMPGRRAGQLFKSPTITCSHCKRVVIINPDRSRSRGYCRKCDHDICDDCSLLMKLGHPCEPFERVTEGKPHFLMKPKGTPNGT